MSRVRVAQTFAQDTDEMLPTCSPRVEQLEGVPGRSQRRGHGPQQTVRPDGRRLGQGREQPGAVEEAEPHARDHRLPSAPHGCPSNNGVAHDFRLVERANALVLVTGHRSLTVSQLPRPASRSHNLFTSLRLKLQEASKEDWSIHAAYGEQNSVRGSVCKVSNSERLGKYAF